MIKQKYDNYAGVLAKSSKKNVGYVKIEDSNVEIPMTIICGREKGPVILITGGIHNAEYVGIQAATELAQELSPEMICGTVIILNLVNRTGFEHRTMSLVYEDQKNLNREFPGKRDGTLAERICWTVTKEFLEKVDYYIDMHCGDGYEELIPYVYCTGVASEETVRISKEMAMQTDVQYLVTSKCESGGAYNYAGTIGVPSILLERGCMGKWSQEEVEADKKDVRNILRYLNILKGEMEECRYYPLNIDDVIYESAPATGCWYPFKESGDFVIKGEVLGMIKDYFGNVLHTYEAKQDGIILYQTKSLCIIEDSPMIAYAKKLI